MKLVLLTSFISMSYFCYGQNNIIIDCDILQDKIVSLQLNYVKTDLRYALKNDSLLYISLIQYDSAHRIHVVKNYYNGKLTDSIIAIDAIPLRMTNDKLPCTKKGVYCIYDDRNRLVEKKAYNRRSFWGKKKRILFWHKYYYLAGCIGNEQ